MHSQSHSGSNCLAKGYNQLEAEAEISSGAPSSGVTPDSGSGAIQSSKMGHYLHLQGLRDLGWVSLFPKVKNPPVQALRTLPKEVMFLTPHHPLNTLRLPHFLHRPPVFQGAKKLSLESGDNQNSCPQASLRLSFPLCNMRETSTLQ